MTEPTLFDVGPRDGLAVAAMRVQIDAWETAGQAVSTVERRALIDQAHAVDLARLARRPSQISSAHKVLLELLKGFGLLDDAPPAGASDPFQTFIDAVMADDAAGG